MNNKKKIIFLINKLKNKLDLVKKNKFISSINNKKYFIKLKENLNSNYHFAREIKECRN